MLWAFLHTHSPRSTCDLSFAVVAVLSVLLRCTACPLNSFGRPQARFQVRICSFVHILPQRPHLGVWTAVHSTLCVAAWRCLGVGWPPEPVGDFEYGSQELLVFWHSFRRPSFVWRRLSAPSLTTAECSLFVGMRERQDGGLCQDEGSSGREF